MLPRKAGSERKNQMAKTKIAIAGLGVIGRKHASAMSSSPTCELTAVVDSDPDVTKLAHNQGVTYHDSLDEMFEQTPVDAVIISTPNALHAAQGIKCVERGLNVLVEKPFATSVEEARSLIKAAEENKVQILVGHYRRFNSQVIRAKDIIASGRIGKLIGVSAIWAMKKHDEYYSIPWRTESGGGPILTNLIHDIDCLRWICGEIESVTSQTSNNVRGNNVEDTAAISLKFHNGALGTILLSDAAPSPWAFEASTSENPDFFHMDDCCYRFMGTDGALDFPLMRSWLFPDATKRSWEHPMVKTHQPTGPGDPLAAQIEHLGRVARGEETPRTTGLDGAQTLAATLAVTKASISGNLVFVDKV